jgi:hypothetical protein
MSPRHALILSMLFLVPAAPNSHAEESPAYLVVR